MGGEHIASWFSPLKQLFTLKIKIRLMAGEIIEKLTSIDDQIHDLRKMVLESVSRTKENETRATARAWLVEAHKLEKKMARNSPFCP
jgi:hypothetical protein